MKIAVVGWGSLIWDPRELNIMSKWRPGPSIPVEFARKSRDGRVTLVLHGDHQSQVFWAISEHDRIENACENLRIREGIGARQVHFTFGDGLRTQRNKEPDPRSHDVSVEITEWMRQAGEIDAVVWTGLPCKGFDSNGLPDQVVQYLLASDQATREVAKKYIRFAPNTIRTSVRTAIEKHPDLGWMPTELPKDLFE